MTKKIKSILSQEETKDIKHEMDGFTFASIQDKLLNAVAKVLSAPKYKSAIIVVSEKLPEGIQDQSGVEKRAVHIAAMGDLEMSDIPVLLAAASKAKMD